MFKKVLVVLKIRELRMKILLTLGLLAVYRLGFYILLPMVNQVAFLKQVEEQQGSPLGQMLQVV